MCAALQRVFTKRDLLSKISFLFCKGGIAQLGERLHGMQEVSGSIPLTSTIRAVEVFRESGCEEKSFTKQCKEVRISFFAVDGS